MKDIPRENFRWAAHTGGAAVVKAKDYETAEEMAAGNPYEIWKIMAARGCPLHPGDVLERLDLESGSSETADSLQIAKYIGFEPARWFVPEPKPGAIDAGVPSENSGKPIESFSQQALADRR